MNASAIPDFVRSQSAVRARFACAGHGSCLADLHETGGLRLKFPKETGCEAVLVNTAGGMAGGDTCRIGLEASEAANVRVTTQSAEKIYRSEGAPAFVEVSLTAGAGAALSFVPQETILFDGAILHRTLTAELTADASLTLLEIVVFGRTARGERLSSGSLRDRWRIRRGGRLVFADEISLDGDIAAGLEAPARGGAAAVATLFHAAPDAEAKLTSVRAVLDGASSDCGASAWNRMLVARFASRSAAALRADATAALTALSGEAPPRIWMS